MSVGAMARVAVVVVALKIRPGEDRTQDGSTVELLVWGAFVSWKQASNSGC